MAPKEEKKKKKKKTKAELEEEQRRLEEEARLAEEERKRQEEAEQQRLEALEAERQRLLNILLSEEAERLQGERDELAPLLGQWALERAQAEERYAKDADWQRYLGCPHLPPPVLRSRMHDFYNSLEGLQHLTIEATLRDCQDCLDLVHDCTVQALQENQAHRQEAAMLFESDVASLHACIGRFIDQGTATVLHHADQYANERNEVQLAVQHGDFAWGLWLNTSKNPRLKVIEWPALQLNTEIPKSLALASIALRVQRHSYDEFFTACTNEWAAVGGVLLADLLVLPPPAKKVKTWTFRPVTHLATSIQRLPYPVPPAGADPATYRAEEEPPPIGFTMPLSPSVCLLDEDVRVGWWDADSQQWSTSGISETSYQRDSSTLSFHTAHLGPLAVLVSRVRLLPYRGWSMRPTGGKNGKTVAITLDVGLKEAIVIEAGSGYARLLSPEWPELADVVGCAMQPMLLLRALVDHGLPLQPMDRDAQFAGVTLKDGGTERAMCQDVALISGAFLVASSRWNRGVAADECLCRLSEILDWEEGGRTEAHHVSRVFEKEKEEGPRKVLAVIRRGVKGVAFSDALDKRPEYIPPPPVDSVEAVTAAAEALLGQVHASLLTLLPGFKGEAGETELGQKLRVGAESLELAKTTCPIMTQSLAQLMYGLRMFTFG